MTEEVQPEVLKRTQETLGKFIKKPVLSEKLLRKPPFRFLHDICTSAMKETGFFEDTLSGNDVKVELINDKEGKIAFLQKVIAAVESANDVKLGVKPNKIVAGHEPIKTNEFLQALAFALEKQVETKLPKKTIRKVKASKPERNEVQQEETLKRKITGNNKGPQKPNESTPEEIKRDAKKKRPSEKKTEAVSNEVKKKSTNAKEAKNEKESKSRKKSEIKMKTNEEVAPLENGKEEGTKEVNEDEKVGSAPPGVETDEGFDVKQNESSNRPTSAKFKKRTPSARPPNSGPSSQLPAEENGHSTELVDHLLGDVVNDDSPQPPPVLQTFPPSAATASDATTLLPATNVTPPESAAPTTLKTATPAPPSPVKVTSNSNGPAPLPISASRPRTAIRPPSARPASARPAAPRIRDRGQVPLQEQLLKPAVGKVNLIVEQEADTQDDDELVSVQLTQEITDSAIESASDTFVAQTDGSEHGHLVSQILEAQKELEEDVFSKKGSTGRTEIEWSTGRGAEGTRREVERLRAAVQTLTRAANPLGKLLEYLQEDMDSMQQELASWSQRNATLSTKLEQERSLTDKSIEPLKAHLEDLEENILLELEQIGALKATVLRNDDKITHLLSGL